jgi:hypothetical protein
MFLWTDPFKQNTEREVGSGRDEASGLVSARWLALDAILRSLILDPEGPEMRAMIRHDLRMMYASGRVEVASSRGGDPYQEAADVMNAWKRALS